MIWFLSLLTISEDLWKGVSLILLVYTSWIKTFWSIDYTSDLYTIQTFVQTIFANNIEVYEDPVSRTKTIPHCAVKFEAGKENRILYEGLYCWCVELPLLTPDAFAYTRCMPHIPHVLTPNQQEEKLKTNLFHKSKQIIASSPPIVTDFALGVVLVVLMYILNSICIILIKPVSTVT